MTVAMDVAVIRPAKLGFQLRALAQPICRLFITIRVELVCEYLRQTNLCFQLGSFCWQLLRGVCSCVYSVFHGAGFLACYGVT